MGKVLTYVTTAIVLSSATCTSLAERLPIGQPGGDFWIDKTEVTIDQFAKYVDALGLVTAAEQAGGGYEFQAGWQQRAGWTFREPYGRRASATEPAVHISWFEADQYCRHMGGRLPTRDQWVRAAYTETRADPPTGFIRGQTYDFPTGTTSTQANTVGSADGWPVHAPVASFQAGVNGLHDMGANVWEWLSDARGEDRLTAGGSWWYGPDKMTISGLQYKPASFFAVYVGFRCVYAEKASTAN